MLLCPCWRSLWKQTPSRATAALAMPARASVSALSPRKELGTFIHFTASRSGCGAAPEPRHRRQHNCSCAQIKTAPPPHLPHIQVYVLLLFLFLFLRALKLKPHSGLCCRRVGSGGGRERERWRNQRFPCNATKTEKVHGRARTPSRQTWRVAANEVL